MNKALTNLSFISRILRSQQPRRASCNSFPETNLVLDKYANLIHRFQIHSEASSQQDFKESVADCSSESGGCTIKTPSNPKSDVEIAVSQNMVSNLNVSTRHDLALVFTCKVCETRSMKMCSRDSYDKGVVVVRCGGCDNLHLIADRLGWFGEPGSIEELLAARGDVVKKGPIDSLNLTLEDLAGKKL